MFRKTKRQCKAWHKNYFRALYQGWVPIYIPGYIETFPYISKLKYSSWFLLDMDECTDGTHKCHVNAVCNNTSGSYNCTCKDGFYGDGINCTGNIYKKNPLLCSDKGLMLETWDHILKSPLTCLYCLSGLRFDSVSLDHRHSAKVSLDTKSGANFLWNLHVLMFKFFLLF